MARVALDKDSGCLCQAKVHEHAILQPTGVPHIGVGGLFRPYKLPLGLS